MKKIITILLSLVMLFSVGLSTTAVMARDPIISPETTQRTITIKVTLNGENSNHTSYNKDKDNPNIITFTYTGDGDLIGWDFPEGEEGVDYVILKQEGNILVIQILPEYKNDRIWANAVDVYPDDTTVPTSVKKDNSNKSPKTGASAGIGIMGAGLAILLAARKRK